MYADICGPCRLRLHAITDESRRLGPKLVRSLRWRVGRFGLPAGRKIEKFRNNRCKFLIAKARHGLKFWHAFELANKFGTQALPKNRRETGEKQARNRRETGAETGDDLRGAFEAEQAFLRAPFEREIRLNELL